MEPMTLGSPGSPTASGSSPYLPGFLMGDPSSLTPGQPGSPTKIPRQVHFPTNLTPSKPGINLSTPVLLPELKNRPHNIRHGTPSEKAGGPPVVGLFDTLETTTVATPRTDLSTSLQGSNDPNESETWVTVFGFPPSAATAIVGHFSQLGHVIKHVYPGQGNWVNLHYGSKIEARRALTYNGRIFGGNIMVGVVQCRDQNILKDLTNTGTTPLSSPKTPRSFSRRLNSPVSPYITSPPSRPRSIISNVGDNEVLGAQNAPAKNTSIVSKTMDYFFGW